MLVKDQKINPLNSNPKNVANGYTTKKKGLKINTNSLLLYFFLFF